ncbi:hypothetical protein PILCRDRAFT_819840 [Piloderma croceum F 1598]|uniref:Uncharacterized protein n=1 Tax=Piloderma croceum (strain F 1598) TaxID=765440 RepID=A0A0C3C0C5_PILCF|nr:hypothetical protein PILCRDRAFT_819840 [Piloderma croceum F 1598]
MAICQLKLKLRFPFSYAVQLKIWLPSIRIRDINAQDEPGHGFGSTLQPCIQIRIRIMGSFTRRLSSSLHLVPLSH